MTDGLDQANRLLREVAETHHRVFRLVDGADDDWASWYADWLVNLSELPALLETTALLPPNSRTLTRGRAAGRPERAWICLLGRGRRP